MPMTKIEMIEEFICPGCVNGSDTKCGKYESEIVNVQTGGVNIYSEWGSCENHCLGTIIHGVGNIALGLPKGFNKSSMCPIKERTHSKMGIRTWTEDAINFLNDDMWDNLNLPVWYLHKNNILFVRTYSPRIDRGYVDVAETPLLPHGLELYGAKNIEPFYDNID